MKRNETTLFIILIVLAFFIFLLDRTGILISVRAALEGIISPAAKEVHTLASLGKSQNNQLPQETVRELEHIKKENEDLRLQLGIANPPAGSEQKRILGNVLSTSRFFIIDKGQDDGVQAGNTVIFKNVFVGKIIVAGKRVSRVLLPSEQDSLIEVRTTKTNAKGLVKGQGGSMVLSEVTLSENLSISDTLVTIGDVDEKGLGIRPGLLVGKIENIRKSEDQLFQEATVVPLLDYKTLENVFVIL